MGKYKSVSDKVPHWAAKNRFRGGRITLRGSGSRGRLRFQKRRAK